MGCNVVAPGGYHWVTKRTSTQRLQTFATWSMALSASCVTPGSTSRRATRATTCASGATGRSHRGGGHRGVPARRRMTFRRRTRPRVATGGDDGGVCRRRPARARTGPTGRHTTRRSTHRRRLIASSVTLIFAANTKVGHLCAYDEGLLTGKGRTGLASQYCCDVSRSACAWCDDTPRLDRRRWNGGLVWKQR